MGTENLRANKKNSLVITCNICSFSSKTSYYHTCMQTIYVTETKKSHFLFLPPRHTHKKPTSDSSKDGLSDKVRFIRGNLREDRVEHYCQGLLLVL